MASSQDLAVNRWAKSERQSLCDLLLEYGPDAPTLCGDWNTHQLAGHLVAREARPDSAIGIAFSPMASWTAKVEEQYSQRPYTELVQKIRNGPPIWSPFRIPTADRLANTEEYFVHLEDVRRAQPDWEPRNLDPAFADYLWELTRQRGRMMFRKSPVGVIVERTDGKGGEKQIKSPDSVGRFGTVRLKGPAQELVMYSFGRKAHANVVIEGEPAAIEAFSQADLSV